MATASLPSPAAARLTQIPQFKVSKSRHSTTMNIGPWTIVATKKPILNGKEIDAAEKRLNLPLPEMTFGNNSLILTYNPSSSASASASTSSASSLPVDSHLDDTKSDSLSLGLRFDALDALAGVAVGEGWEERVGGGVKVSMAEKWGKNRSQPSALLSDTPLPSKPVKPHDWTYSTCYAGDAAGPSTFESSTSHSIPMKLLARQDPALDQILFYEDVPLFEDELHDNGESLLNVRIRVMPHSFFILSRLFVRVDQVLFRIHDVRVYHAFGSGEIIREVSGMECDYDEVKQRLEKPSDLSPLTNPNFVHAVMSALSDYDERNGTGGAQANEAGIDGRPSLQHRSSSRNGKPWPGLGRRVEVLRLPGSIDGASAGLGSLSL